MTRRDRYEVEQDRADIMRVLTEAEAPMRTQDVIAAARGCSVASVPRYWATGHTDLRALAKAGLVYPTYHPAGDRFTTWQIGVDPSRDAREDRVDVERMYARWEPADGGPRTSYALQQRHGAQEGSPR